jgi:hypothetical protein
MLLRDAQYPFLSSAAEKQRLNLLYLSAAPDAHIE